LKGDDITSIKDFAVTGVLVGITLADYLSRGGDDAGAGK
jgi:hypothetical protein